MRHASRLLFALVLSAGLAGCGEEKQFEPCPFDPCLYEQCSKSPGTVENTEVAFSCAIPEHPQCTDGVCLIYGEQTEACLSSGRCQSGPFCTRECVPADNDCPEGSTCVQYLGDTYYCVPAVEDRPEPVSPGECSTGTGG